MDNQSGHVMTLANSIIGVSILAMPYCFKQCGIVLSVLMLLISSIISRLACHFLLKSAIIARRKTFEFLAFHIFGPVGKLGIEIGIIGFLLGTCIAFFVVMGDLGPEIVAEMTGIYSTNAMRTSILMALALFCVFPLGLLRNVDSLNGVSRATIGFYCCLVLKIVFEAVPHIFAGDWYNNVIFWRPEGIMQCLPIFSMALFCQPQLFEIYQALPNATLEKMNNVVRVAVNICTLVYIFVGVFGYIAFSHKQFTGNILLSFSPSLMTGIMKIGFVLSVAFSFPLVIFPCRASLYSLFYKEGYSVHEGMSNYIPEGKFKGLTMFIVFISLIIGIMIPNIELVLGLVGSTIGVMICVLFPVTCFICISPKNTNERILAQLMLMIGVFVMVLGTYKNLYRLDKLEVNTVTISSFKNLDQLDIGVAKAVEKFEAPKDVVEKVPTTVKVVNIESLLGKVKVDATTLKPMVIGEVKEVRHEPPQPIEPQEEVNEIKKVEEGKEDGGVKPSSSLPVENQEGSNKKPGVLPVEAPESVKKAGDALKDDDVDIEAIKKEDKEVELQEKEKVKESDTNQVLIDTIQRQNEVQKEIVEQQKQLIEVIKSQQKNAGDADMDKVKKEKLKAVKEIESIALKAIQKISEGEHNDKIVADVEQKIEKKVEENVKEMKVNVESEEKEAKAEDVVEIKPKEQEQPVVVPKIENLISKNIAKVEEREDKIVPSDISKQTKDVVNEQSLRKPAREEVNLISNDQPVKIETPALNPEASKDDKSKQIPPNLKPEAAEPPKGDTQSVNNTAPLFLKLGKPEAKVGDLKKMMPLPLVVSNNLTKDVNLSKVGQSVSKPDKVEAPQEKDAAPPSNNDELQAIRRDILMVKSRK